MINNIHLIIQARLSSERMPAKILAPWGSSSILIEHIMDECRKVRAEHYTIATDHDSEWGLREYAHWPYKLYPGSTDDVLGRFIGASSPDDEWIMRVCADSPFISAALMNHLINEAGEDADIVNMMDIPDGMCGELVKRSALVRLYATATDEEKEHVTLGVYDDDRARWECVDPPKLSIDTEEEYTYLRSLI